MGAQPKPAMHNVSGATKQAWVGMPFRVAGWQAQPRRDLRCCGISRPDGFVLHCMRASGHTHAVLRLTPSLFVTRPACPVTTRDVRRSVMEAQHSETTAASVRIRFADAHCHPQDDPQNLSAVPSLVATRIAVMGTREDDWDAVERLYLEHPDKVIPCFGVHPWFAHRHARHPGTRGHDIIEPTSDKHANTRDDAKQRELLDSEPSTSWEPRLKSLLERHPAAVVGEFGLDRAAIIPGSKLQVSYSHQLQLTELHLRLAASLQRPVSMHCVRAYGHLQEMLGRLGKEGVCPPRVMLHSFGGSAESVAQFTKGLPGVGSRVYFSFSTVINGKNREKLLQRIRAVPDDRLLLESDQNTALAIDDSLAAILDVVAEAKGWVREQAAQQAMANFDAFFMQA